MLDQASRLRQLVQEAGRREDSAPATASLNDKAVDVSPGDSRSVSQGSEASPLPDPSQLPAGREIMDPLAFSQNTTTAPAVAPPRVIAIASGKGGVGKSHVAANLAYCIARADRRTLLVDADLGMANLDLLLGLSPGRNLGHVVTGQVDLGATLMEGPGGMMFLPGASGLAQAADLSEPERTRLMEQLMGLEEAAELIIIDTGAGISRNVIAFASAADDVLVVTTPEPTAMTDAYGLIKVLHGGGYPGRIGVVVNQAADRAEGRSVYSRLAKTTARFLGRVVYDLGFLPYDSQVGLAARARRPVVACQPAAKISRAIVELSARLLTDGQSVHRAHSQPGFFKRIAGMFF